MDTNIRNNNLISSLSSKQSALEDETDQLKWTVMEDKELILSQIQSVKESLESAVKDNSQAHELRKVFFKSRITQSPFHNELNRTS